MNQETGEERVGAFRLQGIETPPELAEEEGILFRLGVLEDEFTEDRRSRHPKRVRGQTLSSPGW
jgi:hypothetical protein